MKGKNIAAGVGDRTFDVSIRDNDLVGAIECDKGTTAAGDGALLSLTGSKRPAAGTYRVGVTGQGAAGAYRILFRDPGTDADRRNAGRVRDRPGAESGRGRSAVLRDRQGHPDRPAGQLRPDGDRRRSGQRARGGQHRARRVRREPDRARRVLRVRRQPTPAATRRRSRSTCQGQLEPRRARTSCTATRHAGVITDDTAIGGCCRTSSGAADLRPSPTASTTAVKVRGRSVPATPAPSRSVSNQGRRQHRCPRVRRERRRRKRLAHRRSLTPGIYRVGITGKAGSATTSGAFQLSVRDDAFATVTAASRLGCSAANGYVNVPISAGKEYFAVVKGADRGQAGAYTLSVADMTAVTTNQGCGADNSAPDAYFYFNVATPRRAATSPIDMNGSTLTGAFELFNPAGTSLGCTRAAAAAPGPAAGQQLLRRGARHEHRGGRRRAAVRAVDPRRRDVNAAQLLRLRRGGRQLRHQADPAGRYLLRRRHRQLEHAAGRPRAPTR